jgi:hypothetical protein
MALAAVICLPILAGCSGVHRRETGTIAGGLIVEYNVGLLGGGHVVANMPQRGRIAIVSGGRVVATVTTGPDGAFRVLVPPGRYLFRLQSAGRKPCTTMPAVIRVRAGKTGHVQVFCWRSGRYRSAAGWGSNMAPPPGRSP